MSLGCGVACGAGGEALFGHVDLLGKAGGRSHLPTGHRWKKRGHLSRIPPTPSPPDAPRQGVEGDGAQVSVVGGLGPPLTDRLQPPGDQAGRVDEQRVTAGPRLMRLEEERDRNRVALVVGKWRTVTGGHR